MSSTFDVAMAVKKKRRISEWTLRARGPHSAVMFGATHSQMASGWVLREEKEVGEKGEKKKGKMKGKENLSVLLCFFLSPRGVCSKRRVLKFSRQELRLERVLN